MPQPDADFPIYLHLARVRLGFDGPRGRLLKCDSKRNRGEYYWKVKLDAGGRWVRAQGIVLDTDGQYVRRCVECELEFRSDTINEVICHVCERHLNTPVERDATADRGALRRIAWRERYGAKTT